MSWEHEFEEQVEQHTRKRRITRKSKTTAPEVKDKFKEQRQSKIFEIVPKTENQNLFMNALRHKQLVVGEGSAGVGKSFLSCVHAANSFLKGNCKKIVLLRPYVQVGKSAGLLPGTLREKLWPLMLPMLDTLELVLGQDRFKYMLAHDEICLESLENVRGRSYRDSIVILDEGQNTTRADVNALVTRLEESSQLIIIGDTHQHDMKGETGLAFLVGIIKNLKSSKPWYLDDDDFRILLDRTACIVFVQEDIVRSGLTKLFCKVFDNEN